MGEARLPRVLRMNGSPQAHLSLEQALLDSYVPVLIFVLIVFGLIGALVTLSFVLLPTSLAKLIGWGRGNSVWPLQFGLACCAIEMIHTATASVDIARFGSEAMRASPRQADMMIVSGRVSQKMAPILRTIYDQMPE